MTKTIAAGFGRLFATALCLCFSSALAAAQGDPRQAVCQVSWQNCLATAEGKNWKPVYDRCLKARSACMNGRAFTPEIPSLRPSMVQQVEGNDQGNADPATRAAVCENGKP